MLLCFLFRYYNIYRAQIKIKSYPTFISSLCFHRDKYHRLSEGIRSSLSKSLTNTFAFTNRNNRNPSSTVLTLHLHFISLSTQIYYNFIIDTSISTRINNCLITDKSITIGNHRVIHRDILMQYSAVTVTQLKQRQEVPLKSEYPMSSDECIGQHPGQVKPKQVWWSRCGESAWKK